MKKRVLAILLVQSFLLLLVGTLPMCPGGESNPDPCHCANHQAGPMVRAGCCCSIVPTNTPPEPMVLVRMPVQDSSVQNPRIAFTGPAGAEEPTSPQEVALTMGHGLPLRHSDPVPLYLKNTSLLC